MGILLGLDVSCLCFAPPPKMDGAATDVEDFYCFADGHPIQLDRLDHFATQVIAIRLGHGRDGKGATFLVHVLMQMATAISFFCHFRQRKTQLRIQSFSCISRMGISST
jgi:hypothetical protein